MPSIGNRFELLDQQDYNGATCINAYFYRATDGASPSAADLITQFVFFMLPVTVAIQVPTAVHQLIACRNLDDPLDFSVLAPIGANVGTVVGQGLPPFVAWAFRLARTRTDMHHGAKRIVGVSEANQDIGQQSGFASALADYAAVYGADLVGGNGNRYEPRIMRRLLDAEGHLIGYEDFEAGLASFVRISSQNTRKYGRGI